MSRYFELMRQSSPDSRAVQPFTRGAARGATYQFNSYPERVVDAREESLLLTLWRIVRNRKWTVITFALIVVALVLAASFLMKPKYDAVGQVVFHREGSGEVLGFKGVDTSLLDDSADRAAID